MIWTNSTATLAAVAVNVFTLGVPLAALTALVLEVTRRVSSRARYCIAIGGFWLAAVLPFVAVVYGLFGGSGGPDGVGRVSATGVSTWLSGVPFRVWSGSLLLWAVVAVAGLGREIVRHFVLWRAQRQWRDVPGAVTEARRLPSGVRLVTGSSGFPVTVGWFRPVVYLPAWAWRLEDRQLRALVAHEAEHARCLDPLVHLLSRLMLAILWPAWHLRLLYRTVRLEREAAADQAAVRALGHDTEAPAVSWADLLVQVARPAREPAVGAGSDLESRLRRLLEGVPVLRPWHFGARTAATLGLVAATAWGGIMVPSSWAATRTAAAADDKEWTAVDRLLGRNPVVQIVDPRQIVIERKIVQQKQLVRVRPDPDEE